jgi:hypothetical protein
MVTSGSCACDHVPDKNSSIVPARHPGSSMCHKPNVSKLHTSTDVGPFPHHIFNYHKRRFQDQRLIYLSNRVILFQLASASNVWFQEGNQISHVVTHLRSVQNPYGFIIRDCTTLSLSLSLYIYMGISSSIMGNLFSTSRDDRPGLPCRIRSCQRLVAHVAVGVRQRTEGVWPLGVSWRPSVEAGN